MPGTGEKEAIEELIFSSFRSLYECFPCGEVIDNREVEGGPDYLVRAPNGSIAGIEITRIFVRGDTVSSARKANESLWGKAVSLASTKWPTDAPSIDVKVAFVAESAISKKDVEPLSSWLVDLVAQHVPASSGRVELPPVDRVLPNWNLGVAQVTVSRFPFIDETMWSVTDSAWLPTLPHGEIQKIIDRKAPRLGRYRAKCDVAWLVIGADQTGFSSFFKDPEVEHEYEASYDRVFLVKRISKKLRELAIRPRGAR
jgi:hypothetical protein